MEAEVCSFWISFLVSSGSLKSSKLKESEILYRMERELSMYLDRRGRVEIVAFQKYDLPVYKNNDELKNSERLRGVI